MSTKVLIRVRVKRELMRPRSTKRDLNKFRDMSNIPKDIELVCLEQFYRGV